MDAEVYSNNQIDVREYQTSIDNLLSNLHQPNVQLNVFDVLLENFSTNINLINSILLYINEFIKSRSNFVQRNDGYSDEIFILLKRIFSKSKHNNLPSEKGNLLRETVVLFSHSIFNLVSTTVLQMAILTWIF